MKRRDLFKSALMLPILSSLSINEKKTIVKNKIDSLGYLSWNEKQKEVAKYWDDTETNEIVFSGGRACGKTFVATSLILQSAMKYPKTKYFIASDSRRNVMTLNHHDVLNVSSFIGIEAPVFHYVTDSFRFSNGSEIHLVCTDNWMSFGFEDYTQGYIDNGHNVIKSSYGLIMERVGRYRNDELGVKAKLIITCLPCDNFIKSDFYEPAMQGELSKNKKIVISKTLDNKNIDPMYIQHAKTAFTDSQFNRLINGVW